MPVAIGHRLPAPAGAALALTLVLAAGAAPAEPGFEPVGPVTPTVAPPTLAGMRGAVRAVAGGITTIPDGPPIPEPQAGDWNRTCADLYYERVGLYARTASYTPAYYDDPRNQAIAFLGTVTTSAWYLLSATAVESYYERQRVAAVERRLDALRQVSAQRDCFVGR